MRTEDQYSRHKLYVCVTHIEGNVSVSVLEIVNIIEKEHYIELILALYYKETLLVYSLCCIYLCISIFGEFPVFPVSCPIPDFNAKITALNANIPCYLGFYARYYAWCAMGGGKGRVPCVAMMRLQLLTWCYPGVQFNLPARFLILGPSPAPVPAGDWEAEIRRSSLSRTSQRQLRCVCLPTLVLAKGVIPFFCHDSTQSREHD